MNPEGERTAFARAREFLSYSSTAKWTALICSVTSAVFFVFLILALALFADLLVSRGHVPSYGELTPRQRAGFAERWASLDAEKRLAATQPLGLSDSLQMSIVDGETVGPMEWELRWRAYVRMLLEDRIGESAASWYHPPELAQTNQPEVLVAANLRWDERGRHGAGVLSPVVRYHDSWVGSVLGWFASWNPWMYGSGQSNANTMYLSGLFILTLVVVLARSMLLAVVNSMAAIATSEAITRLRRAIYHHTYRLGTLAIRKLGPSEAVSLFTRHVESIHDALHVWLTRSFRYPVQFALLLAVALTLDFWLGITFVLTALLVWFLGGQIASIFRIRSRYATRRAANRLALLQESLTIMRLVKCYLMDLFNQSRVERQLADYDEANRQRFRSDSLARGGLYFLSAIGAVCLLYVSGLVVLADGIDMATLVVLLVVLVSLFFPLRGMLDSRRFIRRGKSSSAVLFEFLDRRGEVAQVIDAEFLPPLSQQLDFANVSLREPGTGRMLLENVNLQIKAGQRVCLIGTDDTELHALVYLIPRFLDPTGGEIKIDGKNIRWVTHESLRSQMAPVLLHNLVFNDTVGNNIGCGDPAYSLPQIIEAAKMAHAHQFIQQLTSGYETPIGDLGQSLRMGEQFRIALARAILRDPAILIIEEPPMLDKDTMALLDDTFRRILPGRTVIFLPKRDSTVKAADQIFLIRKGKVESAGSHEELKHSSRLYKYLHATEFSAFADMI